ncbi:hypothetical protein BT67DRAFT_444532 [Trichocladium antarcticum]|uniref:Uncharacterized protein n=1 Tax=Trichocladium antarcticum TaxID=1450529 RepID=A0AAN6UFD6_9PEZI|nr:hypothetical protein BT67DRAFT_444532 [Trichocladium antarcticum]
MPQGPGRVSVVRLVRLPSVRLSACPSPSVSVRLRPSACSRRPLPTAKQLTAGAAAFCISVPSAVVSPWKFPRNPPPRPPRATTSLSALRVSHPAHSTIPHRAAAAQEDGGRVG